MSKAWKLARTMARHGVNVIPVPPREKGCKLSGWPVLATTNPEQINAWAEAEPEGNYGAVCTPDTVVILDADNPGLRSQVERMTEREFPHTLSVKSSKGFHYYFRQTDRTRSIGNRKVADQFDLQSDRKYVVGPGSIHPSGVEYTIVNNTEIVPMPDWLADYLDVWSQRVTDAKASGHSGNSGNSGKKRGRPILHEDFDPEDFFDWYEEQGAFSVTGHRAWNGKDVHITSECIIAERKHKGSWHTGFIVGDDAFGYHCESPDCNDPSIGDVLRKLNELGFERYPHPIWEEPELEDVDVLDDDEDVVTVDIEDLTEDTDVVTVVGSDDAEAVTVHINDHRDDAVEVADADDADDVDTHEHYGMVTFTEAGLALASQLGITPDEDGTYTFRSSRPVRSTTVLLAEPCNCAIGVRPLTCPNSASPCYGARHHHHEWFMVSPVDDPGNDVPNAPDALLAALTTEDETPAPSTGTGSLYLSVVEKDDLKQGIRVRIASSVEMEELQWLWEQKIPAGKMVFFTGKPDCGKTLCMLDLVARVSAGLPFADGATNPNPPSKVLYASSEDDPADTLVPRLAAAGANLDNVYLIQGTCSQRGTGATKKKAMKKMDLKRDAALILDALKTDPTIRLIALDPITSFFGDADTNKDKEIRPIMDELKSLCEKSGVTIVGLIHSNKRSDVDAMDKVAGARSLGASVRAVWEFSRDTEDKDKYRMALVKGNLSKNRSGLEYAIAEAPVMIRGKAVGVPHVVWGAALQENADDLMRDARNNRDDKDKRKSIAVGFLTALRLPMKAKDIYAEGEKQGLSADMLKRAKREMPDVIVKKHLDSWWWYRIGEDYPHSSKEQTMDDMPGIEAVCG